MNGLQDCEIEVRQKSMDLRGLDAVMRAILLKRAIDIESWQTDVLRRRGCWTFARSSDLYLRASRPSEVGRARRILSPLSASTERHRFDEGSIAHIVTLGDPLVAPDATVRAWCGASVSGSQRWSGLCAFSTCSSCRMLSCEPVLNDERGAIHRLAEKNFTQARRQIDPMAQQEQMKSHVEWIQKRNEDRRAQREQRERLARQANRLDRRAARLAVSICRAVGFRRSDAASR